MRLNELVQIDARFEKAINLLLDLGNPEKVRLYIPTHSSVNILKHYIENVIEPSGGRANLLLGPYGKGKSHLLLVLLALLNGKKSKEVDELLTRIKTVDQKAAALIKEIYTKKRLLPVIVNTSSGNLSQALIKSLNNALKKYGYSDAVPDSYFSEALRTLDQWNNLYPDTYKAFEDKLTTDMDGFSQALKEYDHFALDEFRRIHPLVTSGSEFNPVIDDEVISVYSSVNRILCEKHGFNGIYIVFDEFSKYIEGHTVEGFSADMKVLQDICELCNSSREEQVHITCVAHKAIRAYGDKLPAEIRNAFRGVEGRLDEVPFVVSSQNNYELIADAIQKTTAFSDFATTDKFCSVLDKSYQIPEFNALFQKNDFDEIIGRGAYPLTPLSALLLLNLSERIAQNERTIFTFLTGKDPHSLASFVKKNNQAMYAGADLIYDYFSGLIEEDKTTLVHSEWLKAEYALTVAENETEKQIIKALAVIRMMNRTDDIPASNEFIELALGLPDEVVTQNLTALQDRGVVSYRRSLGAYEFQNSLSIDLEKEVEDCARKYYQKADVYTVLNEVNRQKNILPKKYNQDHLMTRYYDVHLMSTRSFLALSSVSYIEKSNDADGFFILVSMREEDDISGLTTHISELDGKGTVFGFVLNKSDISREARMYLAVNRLLSDGEFITENAVAVSELNSLKEELIDRLNDYIDTMMNNLKEVYSADGTVTIDGFGLNRVISNICEKVYDKTPTINQELINRHHISAQISKARNTLLDDIFHSRLMDGYETGTSPEATIYRAVFVHTKGDPQLEAVRKIIRDFIHSAKGRKLSFKTLIDLLTQPPVGMRKGVIPLYLAEALMELEDMPVVYLGKKEIAIDAALISNVVASPESYSLYVEVETGDKLEYVEGLEALFSEYGPYCKEIENRNRLLRVKCFIQAWYRELPQTAMVFSKPDYDGQDVKRIIAFRKLFIGEPNPRDLIFDQIPKTLGGASLLETLDTVRNVKVELETHVQRLKKSVEVTVRKALSLPEKDDFGVAVRNWYAELPDKVTTSVLPSISQRVMSCFREMPSNMDTFLEKLSKASTNLYIEDWNDGTIREFTDSLVSLLKDIERTKGSVSSGQKLSFATENGTEDHYYEFDPDNISTSGHFFKSALDDILEEYGDSLENSEKIGILMSMVKKLME